MELTTSLSILQFSKMVSESEKTTKTNNSDGGEKANKPRKCCTVSTPLKEEKKKTPNPNYSASGE